MSQPIQPDDLFRLHFLQDAALSPDGSQVVYTVAHVTEEQNEEDESTPVERKTLWLLSLIDGASRQLTAGTQQDHSPAWSPDGKTIAFLSDRGEKTQIYLLPVDGGEARALTQMDQGVGGKPVWSPDGSEIAFTAGPQDEPPDADEPYRFTRHIYRFDAVGSRLDRAIHDIYTVSVAGGATKRWTDDAFHNVQPCWSPDGEQILYVANFDPESHALHPTMRIVGRDGSVRTPLENWGQTPFATWTPDGKRIVFIGVPHGKDIGTQNNLWIVNAAPDRPGDTPLCLTTDLDRQVGGALQPDMPVTGAIRQPQIWIDETGSHAYVQVQSGGEVHVHRISLHEPGTVEPVTQGERSCFPLGLQDDALLYAASTLRNPLDLHLCDLGSGDDRQLTHLNRDLLSARTLPTVEHVTFAGEDGVPVEGWVLLPGEGEAPFPGFLYIHGGPHGAFGHVFSFDFLMLTGAGYAVLIVNHRASTGYGDAFSTAIKGDWGNLDYTDLMTGIDHAIERGFLDPERLALGGLSGGGNLTCWIVGQTNRFKAAIPENPVTNWQSFYGVSDIGPWFAVEELGGAPHEIPDVYRRCSPITYAHRCTTPTLLVQGEHDWRCPAEQSEQFYAVLKANGCPVEMLRLPGASHAGAIQGDLRSRRAQNEALLEWLDRWVEPNADRASEAKRA